MQGEYKQAKLSPVSTTELHSGPPIELTRRSFLEKLGIATLGIMAATHTVHKVDTIISEERWKDDAIEIIPAFGSELLPGGGEEWLVFGGFGQKYSTNAARELFVALGENQVVASVKYPNQGFTIDELSVSVYEYIRQRGMKSLNIAGVSMGLPTALMTLQTIQSSISSADSVVTSTSKVRILPEINYLAAYSSPADLKDAIDGDMALLITNISKRTGYEPGAVAKFMYSLLDGDGDASKAMNIFNKQQWWQHINDSIDQTCNDTPPKLIPSQIAIISAFNVEKQWERLRDIVTPDNTKFVYLAPSNFDPTVNNAIAAEKYRNALTKLAVPTTILNTGPSGHANTVASANALGALLASAEIAQDQVFYK